MLRNLSDLLTLSQRLPQKRLVVVAANDEQVLGAVAEAMKLGIVTPILIGKQPEIEKMIQSLGCSLGSFHIINSDNDETSSYKALALLKSGQADILMKGMLDTKVLLKAVVNNELGIKEAPILSHVGLISYPDFDRVLFVTDGAMVISPTVAEKAHLIENAVKLTKTLGYTNPKVGMVSAVEKVNLKMQSTVDAFEIVNMYKDGMIKDCIVDGPFAIDNLVSADAAKHKNIESPVAGMADILVFPGIDSGNVFYKTSVFLGHAESAGIIIGATHPIVLTSRADSSQSKLYSIALAVVYNHEISNACH